MKIPKQIGPIMRIPPPLMFVVTFLAGAGLQRLARLTFPPLQTFRIVGFGLVGCAVVLALSCVSIFIRARTTIIPFAAASKLVTWGPYRFTRNPMYVSLALAYLGVAVILAQPLALILLALPLTLVHKIVIPFEEGRMREVFGEAYAQYCTRVRRWI